MLMTHPSTPVARGAGSFPSLRATDSADCTPQTHKLELLGRLVGGIAHDLNNLLTVIIGYSDILLSDLGTNSPMREPLLEIRKAVDSAVYLCVRLLAFARPLERQVRLLDINQMVSDLGKLLRRLIPENIDLDVRLDSSQVPLIVQGDLHQLEQAIINLILNARDAMPHGGKLVLQVGCRKLTKPANARPTAVLPGTYAVITVEDSGCGMDSTTQANLFQPFFTTKKVGRGTGLGLTIVQESVRANSGYVSFESEPGKGTRFEVFLPLVAQRQANAETAVAPLDGPGGHETILLVEDDAPIREMTGVLLRMKGYTVLEASDANQAVQAAVEHRGRIDLLLTDVIMPVLDGPRLAEELLSICPGMRVLLISGHSEPMIGRYSKVKGDRHFLRKPFTPTDLLVRIRQVFDNKEADPTSALADTHLPTDADTLVEQFPTTVSQKRLSG